MERMWRRFKMGSTGNLPVPVGNLPTGSRVSNDPEAMLPASRVGCATRTFVSARSAQIY
jgi:hypothetical protein